jgi:uncharacterized repeat protein (TIGR03803 family)
MVVLLLALLSAVSARTQTYKTLYTFDGSPPYGSTPYAGLILDREGNFYGVTAYGGGGYYFDGALFKISPSAGDWTFNKVHEFEVSDPLGVEPIGGLALDDAGNVYGTTSYNEWECGTIFRGNDPFLLHSFSGADGCVPQANLTYSNGRLWGTTTAGGSYGRGTVFTITTSGDDFRFYSFQGKNGAEPMGGINIWRYGVAKSGGSANVGTIYWLDFSNRLVCKHSFKPDGRAGYAPVGDLLPQYAGTVRAMYGTTSAGGEGGGGTVYQVMESELKPKQWRIKVLHSFSGADGRMSLAGVTADQAGNLYGTTSRGGDWDCGTVFKLSPTKKHKWNFTVLYSFNPYNEDPGGNGCGPTSGVTLDASGNLYGTTLEGGFYGGLGTVYQIIP